MQVSVTSNGARIHYWHCTPRPHWIEADTRLEPRIGSAGSDDAAARPQISREAMLLPTEVRLSVARWLWLLPIAVGVSLAMLALTFLSAIDRGESPGDLQEAETFLLLIDEFAVSARESGDGTTLALVAAVSRAQMEERTKLIMDSFGAERATPSGLVGWSFARPRHGAVGPQNAIRVDVI